MTLYERRGISLACRYYVFWVGFDARSPRARCNFDVLTEALAEIDAHPDQMSGGVWDRRDQRWAF